MQICIYPHCLGRVPANLSRVMQTQALVMVWQTQTQQTCTYPMPTFSPDELIGCTYLKDKQEDRQ
jgi:hypothetical protein